MEGKYLQNGLARTTHLHAYVFHSQYYIPVHYVRGP